MLQSSIYYGDLHWHTHFSDNRDRASVEQMVTEAEKYGISILGTGDHNHNLTSTSWQELRAETESLRRLKRPAHEHPRRRAPERTPESTDLVILNNCEMTFMFGHFLVFEPPRVDGTVAEGYRYLYEPRSTPPGARSFMAASEIAAPPRAAAEVTTGTLPDAVSFLSETDNPEIHDAMGRPIPYERLRHERPRCIIDKQGPLSDFDEFDVWLARNEVHECRFEALSYGLEKGVFRLDAALIPALSDRRPDVADRYRAWIAPMRVLVAKADHLRIRVGILPTLTIRATTGDWALPLTVTDAATNLKSELHELSASARLYEFPAAWKKLIGQDDFPFLYQFFTAPFADPPPERS